MNEIEIAELEAKYKTAKALQEDIKHLNAFMLLMAENKRVAIVAWNCSSINADSFLDDVAFIVRKRIDALVKALESLK